MSKWYAQRDTVNPRTDEEAAMGHVDYGKFFTRNDARQALLNGIQREIEGFTRMGLGTGRDQKAYDRLIADDTLDEVTVSGVRYAVWGAR